MNAFKIAITELWGLFVEDGSLAIGILVWVAAALFIFPSIPGFASFRGPALFGGLALMLMENVYSAAKKHYSQMQE